MTIQQKRLWALKVLSDNYLLDKKCGIEITEFYIENSAKLLTGYKALSKISLWEIKAGRMIHEQLRYFTPAIENILFICYLLLNKIKEDVPELNEKTHKRIEYIVNVIMEDENFSDKFLSSSEEVLEIIEKTIKGKVK